VFFAIVVFVIVNSAGWPAVRKAFFDRKLFVDSFPEIAHAFLLNIRIFCIAEALILVFALGIAILRGLPGPVLFPFRPLESPSPITRGNFPKHFNLLTGIGNSSVEFQKKGRGNFQIEL